MNSVYKDWHVVPETAPYPVDEDPKDIIHHLHSLEAECARALQKTGFTNVLVAPLGHKPPRLWALSATFHVERMEKSLVATKIWRCCEEMRGLQSDTKYHTIDRRSRLELCTYDDVIMCHIRVTVLILSSSTFVSSPGGAAPMRGGCSDYTTSTSNNAITVGI